MTTDGYRKKKNPNVETSPKTVRTINKMELAPPSAVSSDFSVVDSAEKNIAARAFPKTRFVKNIAQNIPVRVEAFSFVELIVINAP